jgi:hypothetical protein
MAHKKLPIGIQTFREMREENYYYVDKTALACQLALEGKYYFLSRPRRFGKSLFLDTLKELFEGHQVLFKGLAAEQQWDWSKRYPVIHISFGGGVFHSRSALERRMKQQLSDCRQQLQLEPSTVDPDDIASTFEHLIRDANQTHQAKAVVLIDEYDKPILDNLSQPDQAGAIRDSLRNLYSVLKDSDAHLRFVFLTGVSKFSKVSLFSGLNNLNDITLDARYSTLCGYTDHDLDTIFAAELPGLDRQHIRDWYNGYNWLGESVYNPFDVLLLLQKRDFRPYWFETGTPTFLVDILRQRQTFTPELSQLVTMESLISRFDVDDMPTEALMFQTGYLTIGEVFRMEALTEYTLKYPNREVQASLNSVLLEMLMGNASLPHQYTGRLYRLLAQGDVADLQPLLQSLFASIPYDWQRNNPIAYYEGYYASVFYSYFAALGLDIRLEDMTHKGRIDMTVLFNQQVFLFEFKVVEQLPKGKALAQIKQRGYADKYRGLKQPIHLIGLEFSSQQRQIVGFEHEMIEPNDGN